MAAAAPSEPRQVVHRADSGVAYDALSGFEGAGTPSRRGGDGQQSVMSSNGEGEIDYMPMEVRGGEADHINNGGEGECLVHPRTQHVHHRPMFNIQDNTYTHSAHVRLFQEPFPRLSTTVLWGSPRHAHPGPAQHDGREAPPPRPERLTGAAGQGRILPAFLRAPWHGCRLCLRRRPSQWVLVSNPRHAYWCQ